jgi:NTE family protein
MSPDQPRVAVVLPGGGARGGYEAGALSVLLPALERRGERVTICCGTSVGAINAAALGSLAHLSGRDAGAELLDTWRSMRKADVISPIFGTALLFNALRFFGELVEIPGVRLASLLDAAPLRGSLDRWVDWAQLHENVKTGALESVCVVATSLERSAPVAFLESGAPAPSDHDGNLLSYVPVKLAGEHVRASAAIPLLFPPVEVHSPRAARGHYIDGSTRLNSPLKPALALGADRVIVVGFEPFGSVERRRTPIPTPRLADVLANVIDGLMVDQIGADLRRLAAINSFFVEGHDTGTVRAARSYRLARGRSPYRRISYALVAPSRAGELGGLAERMFQERYGGLRGLRAPDYPLLSRLLTGSARSRGELLSFMLYDEAFVAALIKLGRRDARRWLARHPRFWCSDGAHDLGMTLEPTDHPDATAIEEFRERRRR